MSLSALSQNQFATQQKMLTAGNPEDVARVRGYQTNTANVYKPSFSSDYATVQGTRSSAQAQQDE